jgi:uncharacterized protein YndB with AHSA1/START domain
MPEPSIHHHTFVIKRDYPAPPQRVFAAFSDPAKKRRWFAIDEDNGNAEAEEFAMDFRVGGREHKSFRVPQQGFVARNDTVYLDIVADGRIVFAYTMSIGDKRISSSQATVELLPTDRGTTLVFTEQGAYFEGADGPAMREDGWSKLLDQLARAVPE